MKPKVMKFRQTLFWDVDPKKIDPKKHALYIIERIMDFGDIKEVKWMMNFYDKRTLKKVVTNPRRLRSMSKIFWYLMLGIMLGIKKPKKITRPITKYERGMEKIRNCF